MAKKRGKYKRKRFYGMFLRHLQQTILLPTNNMSRVCVTAPLLELFITFSIGIIRNTRYALGRLTSICTLTVPAPFSTFQLDGF